MKKFCNFIKKEIVAQVFSCEFCEISKNTFFTEHLWATPSEEQEVSLRVLKNTQIITHTETTPLTQDVN